MKISSVIQSHRMQLPLGSGGKRTEIDQLSNPASRLVSKLASQNFPVVGITTREEDGMPIGVLFADPIDRDENLNTILKPMRLGKHGTVVRQGNFRYCAIRPQA